MILIVGLGNYKKEYQFNRHNFGFMAVDQIIEQYGLIAKGKKFKSDFFQGNIHDHQVAILKPQTFMNLSGEAVLEAVSFYKIKVENIIVIHDELDLELGKIKIKKSGGNAGHNGLKSISQLIGNDYWRIRLGISRPIKTESQASVDVSGYVLSNFSQEQLPLVEIVIKNITRELLTIIEQID
jgi:PTH1 family peptidyl-tRNA hydrolase